jgi:transcriptional regulator with XRE-family HTH domain
MLEVDQLDPEPKEPIDNLIIYLRSYMTGGPNWRRGLRSYEQSRQADDFDEVIIPDWVLVFDTETTTTPDQRLRFGAYQLRHAGRLVEAGFFYEPTALSDAEVELLRESVESNREGALRTYLRTRAEFVDEVLYKRGKAIGAMIVGFNLPFDLSRLAIDHEPARYDMHGGFSLKLSPEAGHPSISIKHISQKASLIRFTGARSPKDHEKGERVDRGYFVDVKTLAAALTATSHSLESLSASLGIKHAKHAMAGHGRKLTRRYMRYCVRDVQSTWECFDKLLKRFIGLDLPQTGPWQLYSEASLGKAYLKAMRIHPWQSCQPDFSPDIIGKIMSTYFGGRAEVHIRRQIVPVIHCDFLSMYPTVCTLMGLWRFVVAEGMTYKDATKEIAELVEKSVEHLLAMLRDPSNWTKLRAIVRVRPSRDIFPVRAVYKKGEPHTIGLNYLTSDEPIWFTLADVLASKILTGRSPNIIEAIKFEPKAMQTQIHPVTVAGRIIDPKADDFYRELIVERRKVRAQAEKAADGSDEKARLETDQLGLKILANATSYGIFVELNDNSASKKFDVHVFGVNGEFVYKSTDAEKPGRYFHPLLGTLITGAARLMLALTEKQIALQGLDWAFCDTDSMAIANASGLPLNEFKMRALKVIDWFTSLNPYGEDKSILQLEKVNFPLDGKSDVSRLSPPFCLAVSAKRYALFNKGENGEIVIRKASGHGLGHLVPPYDEGADERRRRMNRIGVPLWQEDLWTLIIAAAETDEPEAVDVMSMKNAHTPAASRYAATTTALLSWFDCYNTERPDAPIRPFNFLLSLQAKSRPQMMSDNPDALQDPLWIGRDPSPASPYFKNVRRAANHAFDRERGDKIPKSWLKSVGRSLVRYHLHEESKFRGAEFDDRGVLLRRHVRMIAAAAIGKETENIEENEFIGEEIEPIEHAEEARFLKRLREFAIATKREFGLSDRDIAEKAKVSHHTLESAWAGRSVKPGTIKRLVEIVEELRLERKEDAERVNRLKLEEFVAEAGGRASAAKLLGVSLSQLSRLLSGKRSLNAEIQMLIEA